MFTIGLILYVRYVIKKRRFLVELFKRENSFGEEYGGKRSLWIMRIANIFLLIAALMLGSFWMGIIKDVPYILESNYSYIHGYTVYKSKGGADVTSEKRSVFIKDKQTGKEVELTTEEDIKTVCLELKGQSVQNGTSDFMFNEKRKCMSEDKRHYI